MDRQIYELRARIFKSLAHPSRLMIIDALREKPKPVGELVELVGAEYATVSRHLAVLKDAGIIAEDRKEKNQVFYRLQVTCIDGFFSCIHEVLIERKKSLEAAI